MPDIKRKINISFNRKNPKSINILFPEGTMKEIKKVFNEDTDFLNIQGDLTNGFELSFVKSGNQAYKFQKKDKTDNRYISFTKDIKDETTNSIIKYLQHFDKYPATFKNVDVTIKSDGLYIDNILTSPLYLNNDKIPSLKRELSKFEKIDIRIISYHSLSNEQKSILNMDLDKFIGIHRNEFKLKRAEFLLKQANKVGIKTVFDLISDKEQILSTKNLGEITLNNFLNLLKDIYDIDINKKIDFFKEDDELKIDTVQHNKKTLKGEMLFLVKKYSDDDDDIIKFFFRKGATLDNVNKNNTRQRVEQKVKKIISAIKNSSYETPFLDALHEKFQNGYMLSVEKSKDMNMNLDSIKKLMYYFKDLRLEVDNAIGISKPEYFIYYYEVMKEIKNKLSTYFSHEGIYVTDNKKEVNILKHISNSNKGIKTNLKVYPSIHDNEYIIANETVFNKPIYTCIAKMVNCFDKVHINDFYKGFEKLYKRRKIKEDRTPNILPIEYYKKYFEESEVFDFRDDLIEINPKYEDYFANKVSESEKILLEALIDNPKYQRTDLQNYCSDKLSKPLLDSLLTFSPIFLIEGKRNSTFIINNQETLNAINNETYKI